MFKLRRFAYDNFYVYENNSMQNNKIYIILNYKIIFTWFKTSGPLTDLFLLLQHFFL